MVAGYRCWMDDAQLLRHCADVPLRGVYQRRVVGVSLWSGGAGDRGADQSAIADQCARQYFLFDVSSAQYCRWYRRANLLVRGGRRGDQLGGLYRARWFARRGSYRRVAERDDDRSLVCFVGFCLFWLGRLGWGDGALGRRGEGAFRYAIARGRVFARGRAFADGDLWLYGGADDVCGD